MLRESRPPRLLSLLPLVIALSLTGCDSEVMPPDNGDPEEITFSMMRIEDVGPNRAVMRGDTSIEATCAVLYGLSEDDLEWTATDPEMEEGEYAINHEVPLEDLMPNTTYYLRATAEGPDEEWGMSEVLTFTTSMDPGGDPTDDMLNVALLDEGTTVTDVSSNWSNAGNDSSYGIHKALDGMETTAWSTNGDGDDAAVTLDFGQERTITHFAYRSRMMSDGSSIVTSVQIVLPEQGNQVLGPFATPDHDVRYVFPLAEPVTARTVRVEAVETTGGNTGAREIQFFQPMQ